MISPDSETEGNTTQPDHAAIADGETTLEASPARRSDFYFEDETVVLLIENNLFRVHRYFLKTHSRAFSDMFSIPPAREGEGRSDLDPIRLECTKSIDFARLLSLFYPKNIVTGDLSTVQEWTSILAISTRWDFELHRDLAKSKLSQIASPLERILLGREFDVKDWLVPAFLDLCLRDEALTLEEGLRLGMEDVILLADIRQAIRGNGRVTLAERSIVNLIHARLG